MTTLSRLLRVFSGFCVVGWAVSLAFGTASWEAIAMAALLEFYAQGEDRQT